MISKRGTVLQQTESVGSSVQTFHGMPAYLDSAQPAIVIFENASTMDDSVLDGDCAMEKNANVDIAKSEFASRGYEYQVMFAESSMFGVPQKRRRVYIVVVLVVANAHLDFSGRSIHDTFTTLRSLIKVCKRAPPCASHVLYPNTHPRIKQELERQLHQTGRRQPYVVHTAIATANANGVAWSSIQAPPELKSSPWFQILSAQQQKMQRIAL